MMNARSRSLFVLSLVAVALIGAAVGATAAGARDPGTQRQQAPELGAPASPAAGQNAVAPAASAAAAPAESQHVPYAGQLSLQPNHGKIGTTVAVVGNGFSAGVDLDVVWQAFDGAWKVDSADPANYKGRTYTEKLIPLAHVATDGQGAFSTTFTVPDGFGFSHDVRILEGGGLRNQASFKVDMEVALSSQSGPPGTPITIDAQGIGMSGLTRSWLVTYDNQFTGWLSSVTTNGHATATIPATGGVGRHIIKIWHGSFTFPYLNPQQSPDPTRPTFTLAFDVTEGNAVLPAPAESQAIVSTAAGVRPTADGPKTWVDRLEAVVGQELLLKGADLPSSSRVDVTWKTQVGVDTQIIGGAGQARPDSETALGTVVTDATGSFSLPFAVPKDKGGAHSILVRSGDTILAAAVVRVRPSAAAVTPASGPVGTVMTIALTGVDDTDTGKIFMTVYDNAMLGYSCSVTAQGQITISLPATGALGWHYIDLYPGIYKGDDLKDVYNYRIPQLTYAADHPGEVLPAFHFAFEVTAP